MDSNLRTLTGWRRSLDLWCCQYQWARRLIGGKWELLPMDRGPITCWYPVTGWSNLKRLPTVVCVGPAVLKEDWG